MNSLFGEQPAEEKETGSQSITGLNLSDAAGLESRAQRDFAPPAEPETMAETIRKSGLAYAAALTLVSSVVIMLMVGWFFDLLAGTSPLGVVGGIVIGAVIGFVQFFRLTSRIFPK